MSGGKLVREQTAALTFDALAAAARKMLWQERNPGKLYPQPMSAADASDTIAEVLHP